MNIVTVNRAKHITLTYSNQGTYTATWKNIHSKTIRRTIQLNQWHDTEAAALEAAEIFVDWCNELNTDRTYTQKLSAVTLSQIDASKSAVAVTMVTEADAVEWAIDQKANEVAV